MRTVCVVGASNETPRAYIFRHIRVRISHTHCIVFPRAPRSFWQRRRSERAVCGKIQVLTRYATDKTRNGIAEYDTLTHIAQNQDISYAVDGEITHTPSGVVDNGQYDFPLTRAQNPLSLLEQCHALLRSRTFSHPAAYVDDNATGTGGTANAETSSSAAAHDQRRKFVTLEAIVGYLHSGAAEWKPLHTNATTEAGPSPSPSPSPQDGSWDSSMTHMSRPEIIRVIHEYAKDMPLNVLYDSRFVSYDSHFCESETPEPEPRPQHVRLRDEQLQGHGADIFAQLKQHLENMQDQMHTLPMFGMAARTMGNIGLLCPCSSRSPVHQEEGQCAIAFEICVLGQYETGNDKVMFQSIFEGCTAQGRSENADVVYASSHREYVRRLLHKYGDVLKNSGFVCATMQPSDLWGLGVSHFNNTQYLNSSHRGDLGIDAAHMLLHPKSGVSLLNYQYVRGNIHTVLSEGDRQLPLHQDAKPGESKDSTSARNVLCDQDIVGEARIAELGFPVLSMLAESPAVMNCVRYVLEVSWKDILDEFVPLQDNSDSTIVGLHVDAASSIASWREKCAAKLTKLGTCHGQSAFSSEYIQYGTQEAGSRKHDKHCPFVLDVELSAQASLMYGPCLLSLRHANVLCDPHLCVASRNHQSADDASLGGQHTFTLGTADLADGAQSPATITTCGTCQVFNPLAMLSLLEEGDAGVADLPLLSERFVRALLAPSESSDAGNHRTRHSRRAGVLGTHIGFDFLFPTAEHSDPPSHKPDNLASTQCFDAFPYWPQHWQAPFGEILHDTLEHVSAFGNYMALLTADPSCVASPSPSTGGVAETCEDRLVLLPDHLRFANASSNYFGTSGLCREHAFGMPMVPTNTHSVCTSDVRPAEQNTDLEEFDSFSCESGDTQTCSCSESPRVSIGGGLGETFGHLWPLLRMFLQTPDSSHASHSTVGRGYYRFDMDSLEGVSMQQLSQYADLDMHLDLQETDSLEDIVRERCYPAEAYANDDTAVVAQDRCVNNQACASNGTVCDAMGRCVRMQIDILNELMSGEVEVGLNSPGCRQNQDSVSGASPWRRMRDILEQHGMCSHGNRVAYERMHDLFQHSPAQSGCTLHDSHDDALSHWVCDRSMVNWTWVRERPDFIPFPEGTDPTEQYYDMRREHVDYSVLHDGLFDLDPHLCDSEYLYSHTLGWCGLEHIPADRQTGVLAKWMRTAPLHGQFSMLTPPQADLDERTAAGKHEDSTAPRDKLRFMGIRRDMLEFNTNTGKSAVQNLAVQQCSALGVCQTEMFTAAGKNEVRMRAPAPPAPPPAGEALEPTWFTVADMDKCGPMGYLRPDVTSPYTCVLDRAVTPLAHVLLQQQASLPDGIANVACLDLYTVSWRTFPFGEDTPGTLTYVGNNADTTTTLQIFLNSLFHLESVPADMDRVLVGQNIHRCTSDIAHFIAAQPTLYAGPRREPGLYTMLDYGTYEVPLFWWQKYALSRAVFRSLDALQVCGPSMLVQSTRIACFRENLFTSSRGSKI